MADPHRAGHELTYYPGETNFGRADVIVINKMDSAEPEAVKVARATSARSTARAVVVDAPSP